MSHSVRHDRGEWDRGAVEWSFQAGGWRGSRACFPNGFGTSASGTVLPATILPRESCSGGYSPRQVTGSVAILPGTRGVENTGQMSGNGVVRAPHDEGITFAV